MRLGKLDNDALERVVLQKFHKVRPEVLTHPAIGADCATVDLKGDLAVLSADPITAAVSRLGLLTVHVNCNDAAAAGATPIGLMVTLLAPSFATEAEIEAVAEDLAGAALAANVDVMGGHTEVSDCVTRMVTCATVLARVGKNGLVSPAGMSPGDDIVMTKWAGMEGTAVIAADFGADLRLSEEEQARANTFYDAISVVPEGVFAAHSGATAMHDITEGGVLGAAWELACASGVGMTLFPEAIPVHPVTAKVCAAKGMDPLRLLGSGSMLIACQDGAALCRGLADIGVQAAVIGKAGERGTGVALADGTLVEPPQADELYKLF